MARLFISHSSLDDAFVRELRWTLADLKQEVWIDSRELRGGDPLVEEIQKAIEESSAVAVREAATLLLGLPWELLHDGDGYLFQGAKPTRVRRRLPNTRTLDVSVVATPIRVLLVTARPEDEACAYIDHRASAA